MNVLLCVPAYEVCVQRDPLGRNRGHDSPHALIRPDLLHEGHLPAYLDRGIPGGLHAKGSLVRLSVVASSR